AEVSQSRTISPERHKYITKARRQISGGIDRRPAWKELQKTCNHCYRADEMAQMMDIAKEFGYQIRAFHHAVEAALLRRAGVKVVLVATGGSDVSRYNAQY